jgi:hypothetical protein
MLRDDNSMIVSSIRHLLSSNSEAIGTVEDAAKGNVNITSSFVIGLIYQKDVSYNQESIRVQEGSLVHPDNAKLSAEARTSLFAYYNHDGVRVHYELDGDPPLGSMRLKPTAHFYHSADLNGRRISATDHTMRGSAGSSIIKFTMLGIRYGGEVRRIFRHDQPGIMDNTLFAEVAWMIPQSLSPIEDDPWQDLYVPVISFRCC